MRRTIIGLCLILSLLNISGVFVSGEVEAASFHSIKHQREHSHEIASTSSNNVTYLRPCYFTSWSQYRQERAKYSPEDYIPGLCTHILYAFAWMSDDFTVRAFDAADLPSEWSGIGMYARVNRLKRTDPELRTLLSIGGWNFGTQLFKQMSHNRTARARFISSVIEFVHEHDFDGIDIDWEYPKGCDDILNYALLFKELRERFDEEFFSGRRNRLLLTAAVSANKETIQSAYNISEISKYVDFILLMSYDFHGAWETETDIHNALYGRQNETAEHQMLNIDWAANYWANQGMPREKIVIGIATYGRGWTLGRSQGNGIGSLGTASRATKFIGESGVAAYYEICEMLAEGAERRWESENQVPYLVYDDQWFTYDDPESVKRKMAWLKEQRFGGAFVWTLDFDDFNGRCGSSSEGAYPLVGMVAHELAAMDLSKVKDTMDSQP